MTECHCFPGNTLICLELGKKYIFYYPFTFFLDSYTYKYDTWCGGDGNIKKYDDLSQALGDCKYSSNCNMIWDLECNGGFWTCSGTLKNSTKGSCTWVKEQGMKYHLIKTLHVE